MKKFRLREFHFGFITFFILIYMEVVSRILTHVSIFNNSIWYVLIFSLFITILFHGLGKIFNRSVNKVLFLINIFLLALLYSMQLCVFKLFSFYFDWGLIGATDQVASFAGDGLMVVLSNAIGVLLFMLPFFVLLIFNHIIVIEKESIKVNITKVILSVLVYFIFIFSLNISKNDAYELYYKVNNVSLNVEKFGVLHTFLIDSYRSVFGFKESVSIINKNDGDDDMSSGSIPRDEIIYGYNNLNIDFNKLIKNENNNTIKEMHEYFQNESGSLKNKYTGYFKGKNLILFMAESFNEIAVNKDLTPTLYKLVNSGFKFNNFYTPTISSTIGGEFQELTGLVAASGFLSPWKNGNNDYPFGIGKVFKDMGYNTYAYHDHSIYFQNRYIYLKSLGFDNFKGCNNGLEKSINCKIWPESDLEMINVTVNDYVNSDKPFFTYYVTVSGHGDYGWSKSAIANKNKDLVSGLKVSEKPLAYLAAQIELDRALEKLITSLDSVGVLDDTVIALVGDHYPYYMSIDEINEISSYKKDSVVEVNRSNFILWNNKMDTVEVDKVGSQIDVLPTLYNLFGVSYDSRLIIGKDILSTTEGLAIFGNRSWVSDKGTYFANTKKFVPIDGVKVTDEYINTMNKIVNNKVLMSKSIMENNYYKKVIGD